MLWMTESCTVLVVAGRRGQCTRLISGSALQFEFAARDQNDKADVSGGRHISRGCPNNHCQRRHCERTADPGPGDQDSGQRVARDDVHGALEARPGLVCQKGVSLRSAFLAAIVVAGQRELNSAAWGFVSLKDIVHHCFIYACLAFKIPATGLVADEVSCQTFAGGYDLCGA